MWNSYCIKLLIKEDWIPQKADLVFLHNLTESKYINIYTNLEKQSHVFKWKTIINIELSKGINNIEELVEKLTSHNFIKEHNLDVLLMKNKSFIKKEYRDGCDVIVSLYSWASDSNEREREISLWDHFNMEKDQPDYSYVNFNMNISTNCINDSTEFMFEGFVSNPDGLSNIYSSPFIHEMREHSKLFLDVDTRQLAFGKLQISRMEG